MIGLRKMMRISHPINESELEHTVNWHFSVDGLQAASDRVLQLTDRLELPNLSRRSPDRLHTSSDGQKFEVHADSLNANYSYKYFGKGQGVSRLHIPGRARPAAPPMRRKATLYRLQGSLQSIGKGFAFRAGHRRGGRAPAFAQYHFCRAKRQRLPSTW